MNVAHELDQLVEFLQTMETAAEQFSCAADDITPGEMRACFNAFAGALQSTRAYIGVIQFLSQEPEPCE
jgi:hypothetical protein